MAALQISAPASAANEPAAITLPTFAQPAPAVSAESVGQASDDAVNAAPEPSISALPQAEAALASADPRQVECMAKVIVHEAGNQPRRGRAAVAQVIRARTHDARFATDACSVVRQPGQFFNVDAYNPPRNEQWHEAVAIATDTLNGRGEDPVPGALFFHAARSPMKGRTALGRIEGHVFYR